MVPDDHGHLVARCCRRRAGVFVRALETGMRLSLNIPVSFRAAYFKEVLHQAHFRSLIPYLHRQAAHHGVTVDRYGDASSLPDLLGARCIGGGYLRDDLALAAPRIRPASLLPDELQGRRCSAVSIEQAASAAAAAVALPSLSGSSSIERDARRAALAVAQPVKRARCAAAFGCSSRTITRLLREPARDDLVRALRMQARWRFGEPPNRGG